MPIIKSAKKRVRVARKAAIRNVKIKRDLKAALKAFIAGGAKSEPARRKAQSALGKAGKKGVMHKNKVARKQRQLAKRAKAAGLKAKPAATKAPAKKPAAAKKTAPKKTPARRASAARSPRKTAATKPKKTTAKS